MSANNNGNGIAYIRNLWGKYADIGYVDNAYKVRTTQEFGAGIESVLVECEGGTIIDLGGGAGGLLEKTRQKTHADKVILVDWCPEMLSGAKKVAEKLGEDGTKFDFATVDLCNSLPFRDNSFEGAICNLVIHFLPKGWKFPLKEFHRILKPGGYLYLGVFLNKWNFAGATWRYALRAAAKDPIGTLRYGIRFKNIAEEITKKARERGAEFPSKDSLISFLVELGFEDIISTEDITSKPLLWGAGLVLRARKRGAPF